MTVILAKKLGRLAVVMTAAVLINGMMRSHAHAQEVDLDTLCQSFPLNSRCQGYSSPAQAEDAAAADQTPKIIKLRLDTSGSSSGEWVRIEVSGNTVKLLHTTRGVSGFSRVTNGVLGIVSPVPLPNFYRWDDHPPSRVVFKPDSCSENSAPDISQPSSQGCTITGTDTVILAQGMDIRTGLFTIEYTDGNLLKSVTFRIPAQKS